MKKRGVLCVFFLYVFCFSIFLYSQVTTSSRITGTVTELEGTPLPGVSIVATSPKVVGESTSTTDVNGVYRLLALPPGRYTITFTLPGFKAFRQENINLLAEQTLTVNAQMEQGVEEEVTVVGQAPQIDVKSAAKGMTLDKDVFDALPKGRNFDSLVGIIAGASTEDRAAGMIIDGATGAENVYYVDGMDTTDVLMGTIKQQASFEFVDEVQIKSSGYQAEFGGSLGGVVNVITRSGGNEFHSEAVAYYYGSALTGKERDTLRLDPYDVLKAEYVNYQDMFGKDKVNSFEVGFSLGGYIVKDKVWFFGSVMPKIQNTTRQVKWLKGSIPSSTLDQSYRWYNFVGKISAQPLKSLRIAASVVNNLSNYTGDLPARDGTGNSAFPFDKVGFAFPNLTATATADYTLGNNFLINVRGGYFHSNKNKQKLTPSGPRYGFNGVGPLGPGGVAQSNAIYPDLVAMYPEYIKPSGYENFSTNDLYVSKKNILDRQSFNTDLTFYFNLAGEHAFKSGLQVVKLIDDVDNVYGYENISFGWGGTYTIAGQEANPYKGKYGVYCAIFVGNWGEFGRATSNRLAFYLQDSWTIANRLTINAGLRAEKEDVPSYDSEPRLKGKVLTWDFKDKLAPRIGVVYDVFGDSSLKVFANYAKYYDVLKINLARNTYGAVKHVFHNYTLDDPRWWTYGNGNLPGTLINTFDGWGDPVEKAARTDKDMKAMSQTEFSLGAEKKLTNDISVNLRFVGKSLANPIEDMGTLLPTGTQWFYGNPGFGLMRGVSDGGILEDPGPPEAKREYRAVNIGLEKRLSNRWLGGVSYTWSRLWGNYPGLVETETGRVMANLVSLFDSYYTERKKDMTPIDGLLPNDRPHFFKLYASYVFDFGLTAGFVSNLRSGIPVSKRISVPRNMYPDGQGTLGRTSMLWTTNVYAEYGVKVGKSRINVNLNIDNVFDAKTEQQRWANIIQGNIRPTKAQLLAGNWELSDFKYTPDPRFGKDYFFLNPIQARVGIKFSFF